MSSGTPPSSTPRRTFTLALLATTAIAVFLGGCNPNDRHLFAGSSSVFPARTASLSGGREDTTAVLGQWAVAYNRNPSDPRIALGYAYALKQTGDKQGAYRVLRASFQANPSNGDVAANLGRIALELNQIDVAQAALRVAAAQGVNDWRTLSAEGTLLAQAGQHADAERYFLAALKQQPNATSVINNLALSYALDRKPKEAETLLRRAVSDGAQDPRIRQNLALVLGLEGKFSEAREVASKDVPPQQARENVAYLQSMLNRSTRTAALEPNAGRREAESNWEPFGSNSDADASPHHESHGDDAIASNAPAPRHMTRRSYATASAGSTTTMPTAKPPHQATAAAARPAPQAEVQTVAQVVPEPRPSRASSASAARSWSVATEIDKPTIATPLSITPPSVAAPYRAGAAGSETQAANSVPKTTRVAEAEPRLAPKPAADGLLRSNLN